MHLNSLEHYMYMHNHDNKYSARPGFDTCTSSLQAPVDTSKELTNERINEETNKRTSGRTSKHMKELITYY